MNEMRGIDKFLYLLAVAVTFFACDEDNLQTDTEQVIRPLSQEEKYLVNASNQFAYEMLSEIENEKIDGNIAFSPMGLGMSIGMMSNIDESLISNVLNIQELNSMELNKAYFEVSSMLPLMNESVDITLVNALWTNNEEKYSDNLSSRLMAYFDVDFREINLRKESSQQFFNKWVSLKTSEHISAINKWSENQGDIVFNASVFDYALPKEAASFNYEFTLGNWQISEYLFDNKSFSLLMFENPDADSFHNFLSTFSIANFDESKVLSTDAKPVPSVNINFEHEFSSMLAHSMISDKKLTHSSSFNLFNDHMKSGQVASPSLMLLKENATGLIVFIGINRSI